MAWIREDSPGSITYKPENYPEGFGCSVTFREVIKTDPHMHKKTSHIYILLEGIATVLIDGLSYPMVEVGDSHRVPVGVEHWVESIGGKSVRLIEISIPAWSADDHFLT